MRKELVVRLKERRISWWSYAMRGCLKHQLKIFGRNETCVMFVCLNCTQELHIQRARIGMMLLNNRPFEWRYVLGGS